MAHSPVEHFYDVTDQLPYTLMLDYDINGNVIYYGRAPIGTPIGDAAWQLRKLSYDVAGNLLDILWANGTKLFDQPWTARVGLSYS